MEFAGCLGTELLTSTHSSTSTLVQMAEERGASLTLGTSGCPPYDGGGDFGPGNLEGRAQSRLPADPTAKFCRNKQDEALQLLGGLCCVRAIPGHGGAVGIFRKAQKMRTGTSYLVIHPIPCSCWYLGVHPAQSPAVTVLLYLQ